jgi:RNA polymerase sigma-70 factor, ECF subfamily
LSTADTSRIALGRAEWSTQADAPVHPVAAETAELFEQYRVPLLRYLSSFGVAGQDGEEVIQEVFLSLFLHLQADKPRTNLVGWIFRVAHNLGLRRRLQAGSNMVTALAAESVQYRDPQPDAERRLVEAQRLDKVWAVVAAMAEQDRQCLFLRAEGLRYRQIAEVLGVSVGTVSACLVRALDRLKKGAIG